MHDVVRRFKALADETRLRILNILMERECCVCEVMQALEISQTRASRNLGILYNAGFLKLNRSGPWALYSINDRAFAEYSIDLLSVVRKALQGNRLAELDRQRLRNAKRVAPPCAFTRAG